MGRCGAFASRGLAARQQLTDERTCLVPLPGRPCVVARCTLDERAPEDIGNRTTHAGTFDFEKDMAAPAQLVEIAPTGPDSWQRP